MRSKHFLGLVILAAFLFITGCSSEETKDTGTEETPKEADKKSEDENEAVKVDKGLLNVEVTLPASMFEGEDMDSSLQRQKRKALKSPGMMTVQRLIKCLRVSIRK